MVQFTTDFNTQSSRVFPPYNIRKPHMCTQRINHTADRKDRDTFPVLFPVLTRKNQCKQQQPHTSISLINHSHCTICMENIRYYRSRTHTSTICHWTRWWLSKAINIESGSIEFVASFNSDNPRCRAATARISGTYFHTHLVSDFNVYCSIYPNRSNSAWWEDRTTN